MPRFEVDITVTVTGDNDNEARAVAEAAAQNMVCGSILEVQVFDVVALDGALAPSKYTEDQIADLAERATFYVTPTGQWLRIDYCDMDEGYFLAHDEESHEEYRIDFMDVTFEEQERFHALAEIPLPAVL